MQADFVLSSNAVFTGMRNEPESLSIAVAGQTIIGIGSSEDVEPCIGPVTRQFKFENQLILPGFHDFHVHLMMGSLFLDSVCLSTMRSEREAAMRVKEFADAHPNDSWIIGWGWYKDNWEHKQLPSRHSLDEVVRDRPAFLFNAELHGAWLNTRALAELGISRTTPDPPFGRVERDNTGDPTGFLYETAMGLWQNACILPWGKRQNLLDNFLRQARQLGVTAVHDMFPLPGLDFGDLSLYEWFEQNERLTLRLHFLSALNGNLEQARNQRAQYRSKTLQFSGLKQFLDGVPSAYTAFTVDPYSDRRDTCGDTLIPPDVIQTWVADADREKFRIRLHACGDAAVRLGLDLYEHARNLNGQRDSRHAIEHIEVIHPDDIRRLSDLGVIASMQPEHVAATQCFTDNPYRYRFAGERLRYLWPMRTLQSHGTSMAFGTDFPVVGLNPFVSVYRAVTRVHDDGEPSGGWNPEERIALADALRAYTMGSAYGAFRESELGTLEVGKLADLVVLDRNLFQISPDDIKSARAVLTMMGGRVVHQA